jgi:hypothetical protein
MNLVRFAARALGLTVVFFAAPVSSEDINGDYDGNTCQNNGMRSQLALNIAWPVLTYFESSCTIANSIAGVAGGYTVSCDGEGDEWVGQVVIGYTDNGGLILTQNGSSVTYNRC